MQFYVMTRTRVKQFTLVHVATCHSKISWIMADYFSHDWLQGNSRCINSRQSIQLCPYQMKEGHSTQHCTQYTASTIMLCMKKEAIIHACFSEWLRCRVSLYRSLWQTVEPGPVYRPANHKTPDGMSHCWIQTPAGNKINNSLSNILSTPESNSSAALFTTQFLIDKLVEIKHSNIMTWTIL